VVTRIEVAEEPGARDAAQLLGGTAGFQVRRHGAVGASAVPSLRGSSAAQVRLFLDGMPLNGAQNGLANLDRIPVDRLEAVEVHRGVMPTGLGGIGGAGAVNFISRKKNEGLDLSARFGSFGERGGSASVGLANKAGTRTGTILVHGLRADNDFQYLDHNQTFHNSADDTIRTRDNAWIDQWGIWGAGTLDTDRFQGRMTLGHDHRDGGRPGPLGYLSPNASVRYERTDGQLHGGWNEGLVELHLAAGRNEEYLDDPEGEVGLGPPGTDRSVGQDLAGRLIWAPELVADILILQTGVEGRSQWQTDWVADVEEPQRNRRNVGFFVAADLAVAGGRVMIAPAWRWQRTRDDFPPVPKFPWLEEEDAVTHTREDVSPSIGLVWSVVPERFFLESHASRNVRQPTWVELFGHRGGIDGNRELQPEDISAADLAVSYRAEEGAWSCRVAGFVAETDDKIIFFQNSQKTSKALNAGQTRASGIELELATRLPGRFSLSGNLTYQIAEDRGGLDDTYEGNKLPFLPDTEARALVKWNPGSWLGWCEVVYMGPNYRDRSNTELNKAPERTLLNLGLRWDIHPSWLGADGVLSLSAETVNLTDNAVYDVEGFPLPGRSWRAVARVRI
jgi:iron complex outermembrane receptor protein